MTAAAGMMVLAVAGCRQRSANIEELVRYVEDARVGAPVRRLVPETQAYVDRILAADSTYRGELADLLAARSPSALWLVDSPQWRDADARAARLKAIDGALNQERTRQRTSALDALTIAIAEAPASVFGAESVFDQIWTALRLDDLDLRSAEVMLSQALGEVRSLHVLVTKHADKFDASKPGLAFSDGSVQSEVDARYRALHAQFATRLERTTEDLKMATARLSELRDQKEAARNGTVATDRERLDRLDDLIEYEKARIKKAESRKKALETALGAEAPDRTG